MYVFYSHYCEDLSAVFGMLNANFIPSLRHVLSDELKQITSLMDNFSHGFLQLYRLAPQSETSQPANSDIQESREHPSPANLFFYFAKVDGWVSETTRASVISNIRNSKSEAKVDAEIDESGIIPHEFCIGYSEIVADKCAKYLSGIT